MAYKLIKYNDSESLPFFHLQQLYEFEFSPITGYELNEYGLYDQNKLTALWSKQGYHIYVLFEDNIPIGFTVVNLSSMLTGDIETRDIAEFFIMPHKRKHGAGRWMAFEIFKMYPGKWEVRQFPGLKAKHFWISTINEYTKGQYIDQESNNSQWHGTYQQFYSIGI